MGRTDLLPVPSVTMPPAIYVQGSQSGSAPQSVNPAPMAFDEAATSSTDMLDLVIGASNDVRVRGFSISNGDAGVQASAEARLPVQERLYLLAGSWVSSLGRNSVFGRVEVDINAGLGGPSIAGAWRVFYRRVIYPTAGVRDFDQINGAINKSIGNTSLTAGVTHSRFEAGEDTWVFVDAEHAVAPKTTAYAHIGYEEGLNWRGKVDWSIGARQRLDRLSFALTYIDTNSRFPRAVGTGNLAGATVQFTIALGLQ